jgi:hypothetical protein
MLDLFGVSVPEPALGRPLPRLGNRQMEVLVEAASEVTTACPWVTIDSSGREVRSLVKRGLLGATHNLFGIMPRGCLRLRHHDRSLARRALAGLKRQRDKGEVMPWHV